MADGPRLTLVRQRGRGVASSAHQGVGPLPPNVRRALIPSKSCLCRCCADEVRQGFGGD